MKAFWNIERQRAKMKVDHFN